MTFEISDEEFGVITIALRRGMCRLFARFVDGKIKISAPYGYPKIFFWRYIDTHRQELRELIYRIRQNAISFFDGQQIKCIGGFSITISSQRSLIKEIKHPNGLILIPPDIDMDADQVKKEISIRIKRLLKDRFYILNAMAEKIAKELSISNVKCFVVGRGMRKLGHCTADGEIQLSYMLLLLPEHLARYVIYHELAHLTHHNHSAAFHQLCDSYVCGKEKDYEAELRDFQWGL